MRYSPAVHRPNAEAPKTLAAHSSDMILRESIAYAVAHGICMAQPLASGGPSSFTHAPFSLFPTPIPESSWDEAVALGPIFARLVDRVAHDREWLLGVLEELGGSDEFTNRLIGLWTAAGSSQPLTLGLHRSDYMIDAATGRLLQVELNTIASSFGCLSARVSRMHAYLVERYRLPSRSLPENAANEALPAAMAQAHGCYCAQQGIEPESAVVLFVVQDGESNAFDQLFLEYELFRAHGVRVERRSLAQIDASVELGARGQIEVGGAEVSVVYFRAGYTPRDYPSEREWRARETLERSLAVKCPSVAYHLVGAKKVQQALAVPGALDHLVDVESERARISASFAGLWQLSPETEEVQQDALAHPENYVLKPQREGGGNNLYGAELRRTLGSLDQHAKSAYILMSRIVPEAQEHVHVRAGATEVGPAISEMGIFTAYIGDGPPDARVAVRNSHAGHILRTKLAGVDEGGVALGFACLSSPELVPG